MDRKDILLYFIYLPVDKLNFLMPIQIMKGLFLIKKEQNPEDFYSFVPYLYGPCSFDIYRDLNELTNEGLITTVKSRQKWNYYRITPSGRELCKEITLNDDLLENIKNNKKLVMEKSFIDLLEYVYNKYPEYAKNSIVNIEAMR